MKVIKEGEYRVRIGNDLIGGVKIAESVISLVYKQFLNASP